MRDCILILEPISTGENYVFDAVNRGFQPVVIFPKLEGTGENTELYEKIRAASAAHFPKETIYLTDTGDYPALLAKIRSYPVVCVVIGSELGAELGDKIASDLDLPGNPSESSILHRDKNRMQERLRERNLPHIRGKLITSVEEADAFLREEELDNAVVKPKNGAGSVGVHLCHGREEILDIVKMGLSGEDMFGNESDSLLLQELLVGTEYIVNTISRDGEHYISDIWRYDKIPIGNGRDGNAYNYARLVTHPNAREYELCLYALKVVDALDITYGPTHGEYMLTANGPVLIEAGARPIGAGLSKSYMEQYLGHHITDRVLDAYLDADLFKQQVELPYQPLAEAMIKVMIMGKDTDFDNIPLLSILRNLDSVVTSDLHSVLPMNKLVRTVDLETACAMIYMCHEDSRVLEWDYRILHNLEMQMPDMMFNNAEPVEKPFNKEEMEKSFHGISNTDETLIFCADSTGLENAVTMDSVFRITNDYDRIFLWLNGIVCNVEEKLSAVSALLKHLKEGGTVIIPESSSEEFPYGRMGIIAVLEANHIIVRVPNGNTGDYIMGEKKKSTITNHSPAPAATNTQYAN